MAVGTPQSGLGPPSRGVQTPRLIGLVAGLVVYPMASNGMRRLRLDDPVDAVWGPRVKQKEAEIRNGKFHGCSILS